MIPQSATNDEWGYREYNLGNNEGDNIEDEDIKGKNRVTFGQVQKN